MFREAFYLLVFSQLSSNDHFVRFALLYSEILLPVA